MKRAIRIVVPILAVSSLLLFAGCSGNYAFTPEGIHDIAKLGVGQDPEQAIATIQAELRRQFPDLIRKDLVWHFNYTGGTLGQMAILYASTKEYILIFGTPIGSEGFSGRYAGMDVYDCMFAGVMQTYLEGQLEATTYLPGDCAILERGHAKGYSMTPNTWMLEYTRGNIPASLPIGAFAPTTLTHDFVTMWGIITDYAGLVLKSMFHIAP